MFHPNVMPKKLCNLAGFSDFILKLCDWFLANIGWQINNDVSRRVHNLSTYTTIKLDTFTHKSFPVSN